MKNIKKVVLMNTLGAILLSAPAFAAGDQKQEESMNGQKQEQQANKEKMRQVSGTVLKHKTVNVFENKKQEEQAMKGEKSAVDKSKKTLVLLIKTEKGNERLPIDVGQVENIPDIQDGKTQIQAQGKVVQMGDKKIFLANKIKVGEKTIEIKRG